MARILIDCSLISSKEELHTAIRQELNFPDYYGMNLDALSDCLTDISNPTELSFVGYAQLEGDLQRYFRKAVWVIMCACSENPNLRFVIGTEE